MVIGGGAFAFGLALRRNERTWFRCCSAAGGASGFGTETNTFESAFHVTAPSNVEGLLKSQNTNAPLPLRSKSASGCEIVLGLARPIPAQGQRSFRTVGQSLMQSGQQFESLCEKLLHCLREGERSSGTRRQGPLLAVVAESAAPPKVVRVGESEPACCCCCCRLAVESDRPPPPK